MANSGTIAGYWSTTYSSARWEFNWSSEPTSTPGHTKVTWNLYTRGRSSSPTWLTTNCDFEIYYNGGKQYSKSWVDPSGAEASFNEKYRDSGTFVVEHNSSGAGSFRVYMYGNIHEYAKKTTDVTANLDINYPYTNCVAPNANTISISPIIQKPGGKITISWEAGGNGIANNITGYKVQYKIENGNWSSAYSTTTRSKEITLPTSATRGATITARVMSVGTVSGYDSSYSSAGGSGRVNILPGAPTVSVVGKTLVPSNGATVNFALTAGGVGDGDENVGQSASLYYATSSTGTKTVCTANFSPVVGASTTYYFWTYDGLEYSPSYASKTITVNTKPTVALSIDGTQANNEIATFSKGNDGQPSGNTYTFGFTYNNQDYTLSSSQTETTYFIGDMRKRLSDKLGSLTDNTAYSYNFWVYRNDGIENSDKVTINEYSLSIPKFTLKNDKDEVAPFSKKITVALSGEQTGDYSTIGFTGATTTENLTLNTSELDWGTKIDKLWVNDSFYVTPQTTLYKVYEIDIVPSGGKISPFSLSTFKTYTTQQLGISLVGRTIADYGLTAAPSLMLKYINVYTNELVELNLENKSNDINTYIYYVEGKDIFNGIDTNASTIDLTFELKNQFNDSFTKTFALQLDHTESAIPYDNINLYPGIISNTSTKYPALNQWEYLKEGMPIYTDFSVLAFDAPTFIFEIYNYHNSGIWEEKARFNNSNNTATTLKNYGEVYFNTPPSCYYITDKQLIEAIDEVTQNHNVRFRMKIQTTKQEVIYNFFNDASLLVKAHYGSSAYFTEINFANPNLETEWVVKDYGGGVITDIGLNIQEYTTDIQKVRYPENGNYTWENFQGFSYNGQNYEFLHIAPVLYSSLLVSTTNVTGDIYTDCFPTTKKTEGNFTYTVVYNIAPTVSYRKNCLGINTLNPLDKAEGVLVINSYQNQNKIYLISDTNQAFLSLQNGEMSGFIMDCGSWDDTSEGDISVTAGSTEEI